MFRGYSQSDKKPPMIGLLCSKQQIFRLSTLGADNEYPALVIPAGEVTIPNNVAENKREHDKLQRVLKLLSCDQEEENVGAITSLWLTLPLRGQAPYQRWSPQPTVARWHTGASGKEQL